MKHRTLASLAAAFACLLALAGCKDRHEPVKPTVVTPQFASAPNAFDSSRNARLRNCRTPPNSKPD